MNTRKAIAIFKDIQKEDVSDIEKALAIYEVMKMPTHLSVTKDDFINVVKWLWQYAFELESESEEE